MTFFRKSATVALALATTVSLALSANAQDRVLRLGVGGPSTHPAHAAYEVFADALKAETGGAYGGQLFGPEIAGIGGMKAALQSQVLEVGTIIPLYYASDVPNSALIAELTMTGTSPYVMAAAATDYIVNCAECQAEFKAAGLVYMGSSSSDSYAVITKDKPVATPEDVKGLKLRSGGAPHARWANEMGATPVGVPVTEQFESISQGVVDGTMASINDIMAFRLIDIVNYITPMNLGTYYSIANFTPSTTLWSDMTADDRAAYARAATAGNAAFTTNWGLALPSGALKAAMDKGITIVEPEASLMDATQAHIAADLVALPEIAQTTYGISDAGDKIAEFSALLEKWQGLLEGVETEAGFAEIVQSEIWDKVDFATYGL